MADHQDPTESERFQALYRDEHGRLLNSLQGLVRNRTQAEDFAATAFAKAWERRDEFRAEASAETWVQAIGRNAAIGTWRSSDARKSVSFDQVHEASVAQRDDLLAKLVQEEDRTLLRKALAILPRESRQLLIDHHVNGRSLDELARRKRVPARTIGTRLFKAREDLRRAWDASGGARGPMRSERIREISDEALRRLAQDLAAGRSETLKEYLATMARFHKYSWVNTVLIHSQRPGATRVAGYHRWRDVGRSVRQGEKGILIYAPIVRRASTPEQSPRSGRQSGSRPEPRSAKNRERGELVGFKAVYVFDVSQTEGKPLPELARVSGDPQENLAKLKQFVEAQGIKLSYDRMIAPADGVSMGGHIALRPNLSPAEEFSVLTHELAHELLHQGKGKERPPKEVRETQAEAVAYVVSRGIGLDTRSAASDYISLYNGDEKLLGESLATIQAASSKILNELLPADRAEREHTIRAEEPTADRSLEPGARAAPESPARPDASELLSIDRRCRER